MNHLNPLTAIAVLSELPDLSERELEVLTAMRLRLAGQYVEQVEPRQLPPYVAVYPNAGSD